MSNLQNYKLGSPKQVDCFFCGRRGPRGREHVFADTLLNHLRAGQERTTIERRLFEAKIIEASRTHTYDSFLCGEICKDCNEGWMSILEATVAPGILGLVDKADLFRLQEPAHRLTFARWAVKTACVIDHIGGMREIQAEIPLQLATHRDTVPSHVHVFVGWLPYDGQSLFAFNQRNTWAKYPRERDFDGMQRPPLDGWFKVAFSVERLMVLVAGMPSKDFLLVVGTGVHVPIWPTTKVVCHHMYHSMRLEGRIPPEALENFSDLLAVALHGQMW